MKTKSTRTEFGKRVLRARKWAGMTQVELAEGVGCGQSNIVEAEYRADASTLTVAIARVTGVDAAWLADGTGEMCVNAENSPPVPSVALTDSPDPSNLIRALAEMLLPLNASRRKAIGSLLQSLSDDPSQSESVAPDIGYLMGGKSDLTHRLTRPPAHTAHLFAA